MLSLSENEKQEVERNLIKMLDENDDTLIGETLAIMKFTNSLSILLKRLDLEKNSSSKIIWTSHINEIKRGDDCMKEIAPKEFDRVSEKFSRIAIFHYLATFCDS